MILDILFAFLVAVLFTLLLIAIAGRRGPGPLAGALFFVILLFFAVWAGGVWITPVGAPQWGLSLLTFLLVGLALALVLAALLPPVRPPAESSQEAALSETAAITFSFFFWLLIVLLLLAVIGRYAFWRT